MSLSQRDPAYFEKASALIKADPALAGQVVRIANSALYAGQTRVDDLERAIMRVGIRMVVASLTSAWLKRAFDPSRSLLAAVWLDNLLSALVARGIAERAGWHEIGSEAAYTYGMLHDVGRLVLMALYQRGMERVLEERLCPVTALSAREHEVFGVSHALAGRLLANRWNFPNDMAMVIAAHHFPRAQRVGMPPHINQIIDLVLIADFIAFRLGDAETLTEELEIRILDDISSGAGLELITALDLAPSTLLEAIRPALGRMEQHCNMLGIPHRFASKA